MTAPRIVVASYATRTDAWRDWSELEDRVADGDGDLIDAVMIERSDQGVEQLLAYSRTGWGGGVVACAAVAALWPPALVVGPLAGTVGGHVMTAVNQALSRDAVGELGRILESGRFINIGIAGEDGTNVLSALGTRSERHGSLPLAGGTARDLRLALQADAAADLAESCLPE